jgi:hypothetical protein
VLFLPPARNRRCLSAIAALLAASSTLGGGAGVGIFGLGFENKLLILAPPYGLQTACMYAIG